MKKCLFGCLLALAFACNTQKKKDNYSVFDASQSGSSKLALIKIDKSSAVNIDVNSNSQNRVLKTSELIDSVSYVALETTEKSLIGMIDKIVSKNDRIFILDSYTGKNVYVFDKNGKFVSKLPNGKGPGEIVRPYDFAVNYKKRLVYIFDGDLHKIVCYNWDGKFLKELKASVRFSNFRCINDSYFLLASQNDANDHLPDPASNSQLFVVDSSFNVISSGFSANVDEDKNDYYLRDNLKSKNNSIQYAPRFKNIVYEYISPKIFKAKYHLDFGDKVISDKDLYIDSEVFLENAKARDYEYFMGDYSENDSVAFFRIEKGKGNARWLFYDIKSKNVLFSGDFIFDDPAIPFIGSPLSSEGNLFVTPIESANFARLKKNKKFYDGFPLSFKQKMNGITENSNPVIMYYSLKRF